MPLTVEQLDHILVSTKPDFGSKKITELVTDVTDHIAMREMLQKHKVGFSGGSKLQWNVKYNYNNTARSTALFEVDRVNVADYFVTANVPWRFQTANCAFDVREPTLNSDEYQIINVVQSRKRDMWIGITTLFESLWWGKPESSSNVLDFFGVDYWMVYNATEGFTGGDPAGFPLGAGELATATYPRWKNYCAPYTNASKDDLVRKMREGYIKTNFRPVTTESQMSSYDSGRRLGYYTNYDVVGPLEEALEQQNDNLGNDLAPKDGKLMFRGVPTEYVPTLEANAADPIYGIDWGVFKMGFLKGHFNRVTGPIPSPGNHNVREMHVDFSCQTICYDRRRLQLYAKSDPAA